MVKSVFTKYMVAFMLIILIGFTLVATVVGTIVSEYSSRQKQTMVESTVANLRDYIEGEFDRRNAQDLQAYIGSYKEGLNLFSNMMIQCNEDLFLIIVDAEGNTLCTYAGNLDVPLPQPKVEGRMLQLLIQDKQSLELTNTTLGDTLPQKCMARAEPLLNRKTGETVGAVFSCTPSEALNRFVTDVIQTIILASFWIMLAAMLAVYIISERIIGPLKHISSAAKSFGTGHYDVRVPVKGDDEVAELALAFNNMASSIADNEEQRRTFLANVSHDLRTPMTTITGFVDGILDGAIPPEKHEYYLNVIATEVRRLSRLVGTLLDITRIQAGDRKFTMAPFNICEMARQILISFEQKIDAKHLEVEFDCPEEDMFVLADRDAIYQILYNICDNGVKFSKEGGKYRIRIFCREKKTFVSVYNEGVGIPEGDLPHIFDRFYKSDKSRGLDKTGVGLGLYIAKTIMDAHHEEIWVKSRYGEYCEFIFTLPETERPKNDTDRSNFLQ